MQYIFNEFKDISLSDRLKVLFSNPKRKKIVFLTQEPDYGTFRYRVYNMCQLLEKNNEYVATYFSTSEIDNILDLFNYIDLIIFSRVPWSYNVDKIVQLCKKNDISMVFDVDDLVFNLQDLPQLANYLSAGKDGIDFWSSYIGRRYLTAKYSDYYLSTNKMLSNYLYDTFKKPSFIIPNFLNDEQVKVSQEVFKNKEKYIDSKYFTIGYFSGTGTHNNDFSIIASDLHYILSTYPNIILKIVGFLDLPETLKQFEKNGKIKRYNLLHFLDLQKSIGECDLNIVPLVINKFTHCKSELKYFESALVGTPTIASPTYVYCGAIHNGINGLIALGGEWRDMIALMYNNNHYYKQIQINGYNSALKNYYGKRIEEQIIGFLGNVCKR